MGKIEWAMWANEQALASGLSEYENFIIMEGKEGGGGAVFSVFLVLFGYMSGLIQTEYFQRELYF